MSALNFPNSPTQGQLYSANGVTYEWSGSAWSAIAPVVYKDEAQVLTNKDLTAVTNTFPSSLATLTGTQTITNKNLASATNTFPTSLVTLTGTQVLTNKDLTAVTNTFPTSLATLTGTQTLTNKTLTAPALSGTITGTYTLGGTPTFPSTVVLTTSAQTLTDKRVTARVSTAASSATPTINTDNVDIYGLTALAVNITSFSTNLSGTPTNGQKLWIYIVGTAARTITWGASFEASTVPLPTTTVSTDRLDVGFVWNAATSKWRCVATS